MKALIVDDDQVLIEVIAFALRIEGFQIIRAYDGEMALQVWAREQPDLMILDVNLPKLDGFAICRHIREQADTPILLLTVRNSEEDIIKGLELGADDYITKPFSPRQLIARAHAVLRRAGKTVPPTIRQVGELILDPNRHEMRFGPGKAIVLTTLESHLLDYLMLNAGQVMTVDALIEHLWGPGGGDRDMLRQLVHRLRHKIIMACGVDTDQENSPYLTYIETIYGLGYCLTLPPSAN